MKHRIAILLTLSLSLLPLLAVARVPKEAPALVAEGEVHADIAAIFKDLRHGMEIHALAVDPSDSFLAVAGSEKTITLYDIRSGLPLRRWDGHGGLVRRLAFALQGQVLVSASDDGTVRVWELSTGRERHRLAGHKDWVTCLAVSPDGTRVLSGSRDSSVRLWDLQSGTSLAEYRGHSGMVRDVHFTVTGEQFLSCAEDGTVRIWSSADGAQLQQISIEGGAPQSLALHPLLPGVLLVGGADSKLHEYRLPEGKLVHRHDFSSGPVTSLSFQPQGAILAVNIDSPFTVLWDTYQHRELARTGAHIWSARVSRFASNGDFFYSAGADTTAYRYDLGSLSVAGSYGTRMMWLGPVAFSPDEQLVATGSDDQVIHLWETISGREVGRLIGHESWIMSFDFSPDGRRMVSASVDTTVHVWDVASRREVHRLRGHRGWVGEARFSPDGKRIATCDGKGVMALWDASSGEKLREWQAHSDAIWSLSWSPDGSLLGSGSVDKTAALWSAGSGELLHRLTGHAGEVRQVRFTPDGKLLASASVDQSIAFWEVSSGARRSEIRATNVGGFVSLSFSPDGKLLATGSYDQIVRWWDWQRASEVQRFTEHTSHIRNILFSPSGTWFASLAGETNLRHFTDGAWRFEWASQARMNGNWVSYNRENRFWRHDDGTFLQKRDPDGGLTPVELPLPGAPIVELLGVPEHIEAPFNRPAKLRLKARNSGEHPAYWVAVRTGPHQEGTLSVNQHWRQVRLMPGEDANVVLEVVPTLSQASRSDSEMLELELVAAGMDPVLVTVPVQVAMPRLEIVSREPVYSPGPGLNLTLQNTGKAATSDEVMLVSSEATALQPDRLPVLEPGGQAEVFLPLPESAAAREQVILLARSKFTPIQVWNFAFERRAGGSGIPLRVVGMLLALVGSLLLLIWAGTRKSGAKPDQG